jgi:hypothetical protein
MVRRGNWRGKILGLEDEGYGRVVGVASMVEFVRLAASV